MRRTRRRSSPAAPLDSMMLAHVEKLHRRLDFDPEASHSLAELDEMMARILNYAASHEGFAAQANLWFNPPILVAYEPQKVAVRWVNERIVEIPYIFRALSRVAPDARVLDVGATESTVCLSLATLGYDVTADRPPAESTLARAPPDGGRRDRRVGAGDRVRRGRLPVDDRASRYGEYGVETAEQRAT